MPTRPRRQQQEAAAAPVPVEVAVTMVDGNGNALDCNSILSGGPPTFEDEVRNQASDGEQGGGGGGGAAAAGEPVEDGRDTNGSFDESVLLYQLCLEQQGQGLGLGDSNEDYATAAVDASSGADGPVPNDRPTVPTGTGAGTGNNPFDDANADPGVIYVDPNKEEDSATESLPPTKYLCTATSTTLGTRGKFLSYQYDVHVRDPHHVLDAGAVYEAGMAEYLARKLGLDGCAVEDDEEEEDGEDDGGDGGRGRRFVRRRSLAGGGAAATGAAAAAGGQQQKQQQQQQQQLARRTQDDAEEDEEEEEPPVLVGISASPRDMPDYDAECTEHYLGIPTKCYHMNGSLALYFRPDAPDDLVQSESENVLRLISRGMATDKFATDGVALAVFEDGKVMQMDVNIGAVEPTGSGTIAGIPENGGGGNIFAPTNPEVASSTKTDTSNGGGEGGSSTPSSSSSALYAGIGAGVAVVAILALFFLRRRKRNALARKYSLREMPGGAMDSSSPGEVAPDGVVIVDKSKSHRKTNSHVSEHSGTTYGENTLPNELSGSFDDDGAYQEVVELGLSNEAAAATAAIATAAAASAESNRLRTRSKDSAYYTAHSIEKTRSHGSGRTHNSGSTATMGVNNLAPIQAQQRSVGSTSNNQGYNIDDDGCSTGSEESGVTIELDMNQMNRVNSTVSDITWAGPQGQQQQQQAAASAAGNILNRFPPYKSLYSPKDDVIAEEEDYNERDEDNIVNNRNSPSGRSKNGASKGGSVGSTDFGTARPPPQRRI